MTTKSPKTQPTSDSSAPRARRLRRNRFARQVAFALRAAGIPVEHPARGAKARFLCTAAENVLNLGPGAVFAILLLADEA